MASSVARLPADEWRDRSRLAAGVFASSRLKKVLRRSQSNVCNTPSSRCSDPIAEDDRGGFIGKTMDGSDHNVDESARIAWRRRQSQIIDRWAARQAKEMVATIERQAHEAEFSALASRTQPVSARAATFLRKTLPNKRTTSSSGGTTSGSYGGSNVRGVVADEPPNVRASKLIQMWRELEAEAGMPPRPRTPSRRGNSGANASSAFNSGEPSIHSDRMEAVSGDNIVRKLNSASTSMAEETSVAVTTKGFRLWCLVSSALAQKRQRDQRNLENLLARMEQGQRQELEALAARRNVSRFTYRGRLQSVLRLRSLRRQFAVEDQIAESTPRNMEQLSSDPPVSCISQEINRDGQCYDTINPVSERSNCLSVEVPSVLDSSGYARDADLLVDENSRCLEDGTSDLQSNPQEANCTDCRADDTQEESNSIEGSWDGSSSWQSNLDQKAAASSSAFSDNLSEVVAEESGTYPASGSRNSSTNNMDMPPDSWRECGTNRQPAHPNVELCELQERRTVTNSLSSDFCNKMNRIISTFLQRQGFQHVDENRALEYEHCHFRRQSNQFQDFEQASSASSRLVPLPSYNYPKKEQWQHTSFTNQFPQNSHGMEYMHDLRTDMAQIRREMIELRRLLESCMSWQDKFQQSIKKEVSDAIRQSDYFSGPIGLNSNQCSSNPTPGRKCSCCICNEMQVDSLLYRCGHMCACYKCATELQLRSGKCPICSFPIIDVVRAYPIEKDGS